MAKQGKAKAASRKAARARLERAVADVDRVLGLQAMRADKGDTPGLIAGYASGQSIGCSLYSVSCRTM
ncbi:MULTISPECIES: hypothetical protein [Streptomyces]|uniref:Uncharacterized protein n=1 Tax=Streptomyces virginiae TaxID=1961 RepID=A0ABZ1TAN1_STRVG|nr:hypothetical protein [Streptomyces virginiae]MCX4957395.1 hypothetical protein [Streptomyces virginiae]MCX5176141.1 hypothetical protein [Streptomyces virginiae]WTB21873.1 hypothetical protein OG253_10400 [Streptomyces virginiae]